MRITLAFWSASLLAVACAAGSSERAASRNVPPAGTNANQNVYSPPSGPAGTSPTEQRSASDNPTGQSTLVAPVTAIGKDSVTLAAPSGPVRLSVDSSTQVLRNGAPVAEGINALHEGQQVSASYDPAAKHADRIDLLGSQGMPYGVKGSAPHAQPAAPGSTDANTQPHQ